jgi:hypothetical protein
MSASWIESCVDAAQRAIGGIDTVVAQRLKVEIETQLSVRGLRPKELGELADQLLNLCLPTEADRTDANQGDLS